MSHNAFPRLEREYAEDMAMREHHKMERNMGYFSEQAEEQYERGEQDLYLAEMHEMTIQALRKCVPVLSAEELGVLCFHAGIQPKDLLGDEKC